MSNPFDAMAQTFIDQVTNWGTSVTYLHGGDAPKAIKALIEFEQKYVDEIEGRSVVVQPATLRIADDDTYGMLEADVDHRDRVTIGSKTWSVVNGPKTDEAGMLELDIKHVEDRHSHGPGVRKS